MQPADDGLEREQGSECLAAGQGSGSAGWWSWKKSKGTKVSNSRFRLVVRTGAESIGEEVRAAGLTRHRGREDGDGRDDMDRQCGEQQRLHWHCRSGQQRNNSHVGQTLGRDSGRFRDRYGRLAAYFH